MVVEVLAGMILMFLSRWRRLPGEETHIWLLPPNMAVILSQAATFGEQQQKLQVSIQFNNLTKSEGMFLDISGHHWLHQVLQITIIARISFCPQTTPDQSEYEQTPSDLVFTISDVNPEIGCTCLNMSKEGWQCKCCVYSRVLAKLT